ncbi:MAG: rod shape-determining protein MreC [Bdellovibrionales bacterium]|nr:rod shape-determining protein MreC [Bdellovibrionales bacterium]
MADFIRRHSLFLTALGLIAASFQLMSASIDNTSLPRLGGTVLHTALAPVQEVHHKSLSSVKDVWHQYLWLVGVQAERDELTRRLKLLEAQNSRLLEYEHENNRLRKLLFFKRGTGFEGVTGTVIGSDPSHWERTITVDKGSELSVKEEMPVVDGEAIVGQTTVVASGSSKVLLITDKSSAIDAIVQRSRATGVVEGTGSDTLRLRYVLKEMSVQPGDRVIASGLGGIYPKGTLIGVVVDVKTPNSGLFHEVLVKPSVDLRRLENVLIITSELESPAVEAKPQTAKPDKTKEAA